MHLTNYAVNKLSKDFVTADGDAHQGSKRKLTALLNSLAAQGYDTKALWYRVSSLIVKTLLSISPQLEHTYHTTCTKSKSDRSSLRHKSRCFELLGFDVLLDDDLKPWLMEVNHSPSFNTDTALDTEVKNAVLHDTIHSLGLSVAARTKYLNHQ
ncbi:hypothetical protein CYMTET_35758, partial [Cymbomonas tetramitiformis]